MIINKIQKSETPSKSSAPQKTTAEQVYVKRLTEQEAFMGKDEFKKKHFQINRLMKRHQSAVEIVKPAYYSHINEIRSIKEFLYISEKLKQKNIERKMQERLDLRGKLNQIKEIEIAKKMHYILEKRIRQHIKHTQHSDDPYDRTFEAFFKTIENDPKLSVFSIETMKNEYHRCQSTAAFDLASDTAAQKQKTPPHSPNHQLQQKNTTEVSDSMIDAKEQGTSKFLTMKVANKLLGLMLVEQSKGKRIPIIMAVDKKKELNDMLDKPFGGKMNFTVNSFTWLIESTLAKGSAHMQKQIHPFQVSGGSTGRIKLTDVPHPVTEIQNEIDNQMKSIKKTLAGRPMSSAPVRTIKNLKNRKTITVEYGVGKRIKENVQSQMARNLQVREQSRMCQDQVQNDSYVSHYI